MLLFYASNGMYKTFRPAKKAISNATGIPETRIKDIRKSLQRLSVIDYEYNEKYKYIFVNWTVIYAYADLPEPLKMGNTKNGEEKRKYFIQQSQHEYERHPRNDQRTISKQKQHWNWEVFDASIAGMTAEEQTQALISLKNQAFFLRNGAPEIIEGENYL